MTSQTLFLIFITILAFILLPVTAIAILPKNPSYLETIKTRLYIFKLVIFSILTKPYFFIALSMLINLFFIIVCFYPIDVYAMDNPAELEKVMDNLNYWRDDLRATKQIYDSGWCDTDNARLSPEQLRYKAFLEDAIRDGEHNVRLFTSAFNQLQGETVTASSAGKRGAEEELSAPKSKK